MKTIFSRYVFRYILILVFVCSYVSIGHSKDDAEQKQEIPISSWLLSGTISQPLPVFNEDKNIEGKTFTLEDLLKFDQANIKNLLPARGEKFGWRPDLDLQWEKVTADSSNTITFLSESENIPEINYLASYINAKRWTKANLEISGAHLFQVYLDGELLNSKTSSDTLKENDDQDKQSNISHEIKLETGKHILLIKSLHDPKNNMPWNISTTLKLSEDFPKDALQISTSPRHVMNMKHLLYTPVISNISISPDGDIVATAMTHYTPPDNDKESWLELRKVSDGSLIQTYRGGMSISNIKWAPVGKKFSYTSNKEEKYTLWIVDLDKGTTTALLENIKDFGSYSWAHDGSFIIYSITDKAPEDKNGVHRLKGMEDRQPYLRNRNFLYMVNVAQGTRRRLTVGEISTDLNSVSPDGKKIIFSRLLSNYEERPFSKTQFYILNLATLKLDSLWISKWGGFVQWSPDGKKLLVIGAPSMFGDIGVNVPVRKDPPKESSVTFGKGTIPNDYDTQAYIYDFKTGSIEPITRDFDPQINQAIWSKTENAIYFRVTDRSYGNLYRYDLKKKRFNLIKSEVEVMRRLDIANNKAVAIYYGSSAAVPYKAYIMDLKKKRSRLLVDPGKKDYKDVVLSKIERWTFKNERNFEIEGRIYYPPNFDPKKKYPCIVYYYGGTSPVTRDFDGRYPKNLYSAQGYVVYVMQPSGATGFGQEFSALHVNEWGTIVVNEIIDGTKKFLAAHPFIDKSHVGCIGASYGGFTTELLLTKTDIFSAAVSHAGISSIASYWGEGYWGYEYGAVANANSFPWNKKEYFINQSALFNADKINTPILLTHGMADTNVPPGESIQLYTALKLLGREVELIQFDGENHFILDYNKRSQWTKSIMAWFDKWLKEQPEWWDDLYGGK